MPRPSFVSAPRSAAMRRSQSRTTTSSVPSANAAKARVKGEVALGGMAGLPVLMRDGRQAGGPRLEVGQPPARVAGDLDRQRDAAGLAKLVKGVALHADEVTDLGLREKERLARPRGGV